MAEQNENNNLSQFFNLKNYLLYSGLFFLISAAALFYIYQVYADEKSLEIIFNFPLPIITSLIILLFFYYLFDALRLYFVLKTLKAEISFWEIYKLVFINIFVSNITPLATGGGVAQAYFLQKNNVPLGTSSAAVLIRTLLSAIILFVNVPFIIFRNKNMVKFLSGHYLYLYLIIFIGLYISVFYFLIFKNQLLMKLIYKILSFLKDRHLLTKKRFKIIIRFTFQHLKLFAEDLAFFIQGKKIYVFLAIFFTIIFLLAEFSFSYLLLIGLGYQIPFVHIVSLQILVVFIMYFAPTPGAAGIAEGGYSLLFSRFVDRNDIFPLLFYWRFFSKYIGIFIGVLVFIYFVLRGESANEE